MELHLIRHPQPDIPPGVCYGQSDIGLLEPAAVAASRLRPLLPAEFLLFASPLMRARQLADELGTPVLDDRLKEISFGDWELRRFDDIGLSLDDWAKDFMGFSAPGGESVRDLAARVTNWFEELSDSPPDLPVVIVAHGGPLRVIAGHLLGVPTEKWMGLDFACAHTTRIDCESWGTLLKWFNR